MEQHPPDWVPLQTLTRQARLSNNTLQHLIRLGVLPSVKRTRNERLIEPYSAWELLKIRARFRYLKILEDYVADTGKTELSYVELVRYDEQRKATPGDSSQGAAAGNGPDDEPGSNKPGCVRDLRKCAGSG